MKSFFSKSRCTLLKKYFHQKQSSRNVPVLSCQTSIGQILLRTDTRLVFCNRKLMRTDIFFTRTTKPICNFANSIVLMFNININYTTARMDYAISARPSRTPIVIRGESRWTQKSDRGNWFVVSSYKQRCPWWTAKNNQHYV
jgi:hypothetical protein